MQHYATSCKKGTKHADLLQLLNPIALLSMAAVIIPVLVHLWNVRKGKTLRIGSIALLAASARTRSNRLRIHQWPLFLLRCLLLVLLALLLAIPVWNKKQTTQKGWILVQDDQLPAVYAQYGVTIDSLLGAGLEIHNLSAQFELLNLKDTVQYTGAANHPQPLLPPWSLLRVLDTHLPKGFPLHVFANNRLALYEGKRPATQLSIHWHRFSISDSQYRSPAFGWVTPDGKITQQEWVSRPDGNYYEAVHTGSLLTAGIDTAIIRATIYAGKNVTDAQYVKAALQAISSFTGKRINLTSLQTGQSPSTPQQLIFQLDETIDARLLSYLAPNGILFKYDTGHAFPVSSSWQEGMLTGGEGMQHKVYRYIPGSTEGLSVWTLADGRPLLMVTEQDNKRTYTYKSRFNPAWSDMVWEDDFVKTLLPLVLPAPVTMKEHDIRRIDDRQIVPQKRIQNLEYRMQNTEYSMQNRENLSMLTWIMAFIVLVTERILAYRQQQRTHNA